MISFFDRYRSVIRFLCVGGIGFIIDASFLFLLGIYIPYSIARGLSFWIAASSNWWLNRNYTFVNSNVLKREGEHGKLRQWLAFLSASCIGFIPSWLCYFLLLEHTLWAINYPVFAIVPGILSGMIINYLLAKHWVFNRGK